MKDLFNIALVGNPNCGKTTLFNGLTGSIQRIGNWPGVTVEKKEGIMEHQGQKINIVDLPGIYSLSAASEDEEIARDYILSGEPDLVVNIIDSTNLQRNLYLTVQLLEMQVPVLVVLNMMDLVQKNNTEINIKHLQKHLDCPIIGIAAVNNNDLQQTKDLIISAIKSPKQSEASVTYPNEIEGIISEWDKNLHSFAQELGTNSRWVALKLLEQDNWVTEKIVKKQVLTETAINSAINKIKTILGDLPDIVLADYRYGFIESIYQHLVKKGVTKRSFSDRLDQLVLNRILGIPIFLVVMYAVFWVTITIGGAFIDFFDIFFGTIFVDGFAVLLSAINSPEWLITILAGGIGAGIQTVATFIPIIFMMFLMLSLLEDSGYMARAAFVMDRFMRWIGLPGKSFVPMIVGFGCTVPAIMATRTLESKKDRFMTVFMSPFMSCGARLPVYALFGAAFFGVRAGAMVFSIYLAGIILAILTGLLLKRTLFQGEPSHFIMELPSYHRPRFKHIMLHTWNRLKIFMVRAGKVIVVVVAILALLNSVGTDGTFGNEDSTNSVLAKIGQGITPIFTPMGVEQDNWPASVALFTGLFAKEAVVGTLDALYSQIDLANEQLAGDNGLEEEEGFDFWAGISEAFYSIPEGLSGIWGGLSDPLGMGMISDDQDSVSEEVGAATGVFGAMRRRFQHGPNQAYAYLLFILIYVPCVAAIGAAIREIGYFYGILMSVYQTILAWIVATLYYQFTVAHQVLWIVVALAIVILIYLGMKYIGQSERNRGNFGPGSTIDL